MSVGGAFPTYVERGGVWYGCTITNERINCGACRIGRVFNGTCTTCHAREVSDDVRERLQRFDNAGL